MAVHFRADTLYIEGCLFMRGEMKKGGINVKFILTVLLLLFLLWFVFGFLIARLR